VACSSSFAYTGLTQGAHTLVVTAVDRVGNVATNALSFRTGVISAVSAVQTPSAGAASLPAALGALLTSLGITMVALALARRRYR
jgi:hypothetical protein